MTQNCSMRETNDERKKSLISCLKFAAEAHENQKRKDSEKTPYINHPIGVAYILSYEGKITNLDLLRGCLLHDTVEDTSVTIDDIRVKFGDYIGNLVQEVTDDKSLPKQKRKDLQVVHGPTSSPQAKLVKLADKLYNLRDLERRLPEGWTEVRRREYFRWASQVCQGLRGVCRPLEEQLNDVFKRNGVSQIANSKSSGAESDATSWPDHSELKPLVATANFAAERHSRHFTFDASNCAPFINHVISVAWILCEEAEVKDTNVLCAALLHSVVGRGTATIEEVVELFGDEVGKLVSELTVNHSLLFKDQFQSQMSQVQMMSGSARLITLAAMVDNCRRLADCDAKGSEGIAHGMRRNYFQWAGELAALLTGTHSRLEQELKHVLGN